MESAYRSDASRAGWTTEADLLDGQRTDEAEVLGFIEGEPEDSRIVLGVAATELVASMLMVRESSGVYLGMIAVRPDRQGRGMGSALLREAERIASAERLGASFKTPGSRRNMR